MGAEIAVGGAGELFQPRKFQARGSRQRVQRRHDLQPQRLVDDVVELGHGSSAASRGRRGSVRRR